MPDTFRMLARGFAPLLRAGWSGYVFGLAAVALVTLLVAVFPGWEPPANASALYVLTILVTATLYGRAPALLASAAASLAFDFYFVPPKGEFSFNDWHEVLTLGVFVITALVAGQLATALRQQAAQAREREREALALYEVARLVPGSTLELQPLLGLMLDQLKTIVDYDAAAVILLDERDEPVVFDYRGPLPRVRVLGLHLSTNSAMSALVHEVDRRRQPVLVQHAVGASRVSQDLAAAGVLLPPDAPPEHSGLAVPLIVKGRVIGVQTLLRSTLSGFTPKHAELAMFFAQQAAVAIENARLYGQSRERLNEMVGLQKLGSILLQEHDFDRVLPAVCLQLQDLTDAESVAVVLLEEQAGYFEIRTVTGSHVAELRGAHLPVEGSFAAEAIRTNLPQRSDDAQRDPRGFMPLLAAAGVRSLLTVPMRTRERVVGVISIYDKRGGPGFTDRDAELATLFAQQAAVAIENARLYDEVRDKAALEERQRLARELHDSVSQALYGIALNASAADELLETAPERTRGLLQDVLHLADAGLAELRALIFELRPESLEREGLVGALEKQAAAVRARHGLEVHLEVGEEPDLPQSAKEALYRVAQEALQNAVKHARARTLDVVLELQDAQVGLMVADDGRGFHPDGEFPGHLGLESMRERAAAVGGTLEIHSAPGKGTRLQARVPVRVPSTSGRRSR